jgi:hypothetical protein
MTNVDSTIKFSETIQFNKYIAIFGRGSESLDPDEAGLAFVGSVAAIPDEGTRLLFEISILMDLFATVTRP